MPQEAKVKYIYDGAAYGNTDLVWQTRGGNVRICSYAHNVYSTKNRPLDAPTQEEQKYWSTPDDPKKPEDDISTEYFDYQNERDSG